MKIKYWIQTDKIGSKCQDVIEVDDDEWNDMDDKDREEMMKEYAFSHVDWSYETV